jgi:hypothetical protein
MNSQQPETPIPKDPDAELENAFIAEFLRDQGYDPHCLHELPEELVRRLLTEASVYASCRLSEIEARARFVSEVHGVTLPV